MAELDLGIFEPSHVHKIILNDDNKRFAPMYKVSREDINKFEYKPAIFLKREFPVNHNVSAYEDIGYLLAKEVAFKLNIIYSEILDSLNERWELSLFMAWLEGESDAFDVYTDAYRDLSLIKGDIDGETGTEVTEPTEPEGSGIEPDTGTDTSSEGETQTTENDTITQDRESQETVENP